MHGGVDRLDALYGCPDRDTWETDLANATDPTSATLILKPGNDYAARSRIPDRADPVPWLETIGDTSQSHRISSPHTNRAAIVTSFLYHGGWEGRGVSVLDIATRYVELGFSVIPVRCDGTKAPLLPGWREFSERRPTGEELLHWFGNGTVAGIGIPCGPASGHMAVLDFETAEVWDKWRGNVSIDTVDFLEHCPIVRTPSGGVHVWVRLPESTPGTVLARDKEKGVLIEIRGSGHQVLAPGCPVQCHKLGLPYQFIQKPNDTCSSIPMERFCGVV